MNHQWRMQCKLVTSFCVMATWQSAGASWWWQRSGGVRDQSGHASCFLWLIAAKILLLNTALHCVHQDWLVMEKGGDFCLDYILSGATCKFYLADFNYITHIHTEHLNGFLLIISMLCLVVWCGHGGGGQDVSQRMSWFLVLESVTSCHVILC